MFAVDMDTDTFWTNPQYRVTVIDADEGDDDNTGTLIVALLQKERRLKRHEGCDLLTVGYAIYKVRVVLRHVAFTLPVITTVRNI